MSGEQEEKATETEVLDNAIKDGEAAEVKDNAEFDKQRQRADMEAANARKARDRATEAEGGLEAAKAENDTLKELLAAAEAKAAEAGIKNVELDEKNYETTDIPLVRAIKALNERIDAKDKQITTLEKKATGYEAQDRQDKATQARNTAYEELLTDLDAEYGADCRNEAVKAFNELITAGKVPKGSPAKATRAMEKCYKAAKAAKAKTDTEKSSSLSLDSGSGGGSALNLSGVEIKEGSLDEVAEQVGKTAFGTRKS